VRAGALARSYAAPPESKSDPALPTAGRNYEVKGRAAGFYTASEYSDTGEPLCRIRSMSRLQRSISRFNLRSDAVSTLYFIHCFNPSVGGRIAQLLPCHRSVTYRGAVQSSTVDRLAPHGDCTHKIFPAYGFLTSCRRWVDLDANRRILKPISRLGPFAPGLNSSPRGRETERSLAIARTTPNLHAVSNPARFANERAGLKHSSAPIR